MVREKLTPFQGQQLSSDLMRELNSAVTGVDSHLSIGIRTGASGGSAALTIRLTDGTASQAPAAAATSTASFAATPGVQRLRVGGAVQEAKLTNAPTPEYPPLARSARIQGVVRFNAVIGVDGRIQNLQLVSGHPLLVASAQAVVSQYVYRTTLLNGEPVEVQTQVDVNFALQ
jgi:periplasmic protein TonB